MLYEQWFVLVSKADLECGLFITLVDEIVSAESYGS